MEIYSNEDSGIRVEKTEKLINVYLIDDQHWFIAVREGQSLNKLWLFKLISF